MHEQLFERFGDGSSSLELPRNASLAMADEALALANCPSSSSLGVALLPTAERHTVSVHRAAMAKLEVNVWSDVACPWCWVGLLRYKKAVAKVAKQAKVHVETKYHPYIIDPRTKESGKFDAVDSRS